MFQIYTCPGWTSGTGHSTNRNIIQRRVIQALLTNTLILLWIFGLFSDNGLLSSFLYPIDFIFHKENSPNWCITALLTSILLLIWIFGLFSDNGLLSSCLYSIEFYISRGKISHLAYYCLTSKYSSSCMDFWPIFGQWPALIMPIFNLILYFKRENLPFGVLLLN